MATGMGGFFLVPAGNAGKGPGAGGGSFLVFRIKDLGGFGIESFSMPTY